MTPLAANLRHLYQRRGMWWMYGFMAVMSCSLLMMYLQKKDTGRDMFFAFPLFLACVVGIYVADHAVGILSSPVSFCLPYHQKVARQFLTIVGGVVSMVLALIFLAYPGLPWPLHLTALVWGFCANLACYSLGAMIMISRSSGPVVRGLIGWIFLLAFFAVNLDAHLAIVKAIVEGNHLLMGICLVISGLAWSRWGKRDVARRSCGTPRMSGFDAWNTEKLHRAAQVRWAARPTRPNWVTARIERFFLSRMSACRPLSGARGIWGGVYATFGGFGSGWKGLIFVIVFFALYFGYLGPQASWFVFVFGSFLSGSFGLLPVYLTLPVLSGRQERFLTGIGVALTGCVFSVTILGGAVLLTHLIAPFVPDVTLKGQVFSLQPMRPMGLWITVAVVPLVQAIRLFWPKRWLIPFMFFFGTMPVVMMVMMNDKESFRVWVLPTAIGLVALSWSLFLAVLHRVCFRWDLVLQ